MRASPHQVPRAFLFSPWHSTVCPDDKPFANLSIHFAEKRRARSCWKIGEEGRGGEDKKKKGNARTREESEQRQESEKTKVGAWNNVEALCLFSITPRYSRFSFLFRTLHRGQWKSHLVFCRALFACKLCRAETKAEANANTLKPTIA